MLKLIKPYDTNEQLYWALKAGDNKAFHHLISKIKSTVHGLCRDRQLASRGDDILQQTLTILLRKLENGSYVFQNNASPATFTIGIAKNLILNFIRGSENSPADINSFENVLWTSNQWDGVKETVTFYLSLLGEDCRQLIRLRKLEDYKYKEIIEQKLMPKYTNEGSLRNKFESCWNKWMETIQKVEQ